MSRVTKIIQLPDAFLILFWQLRDSCAVLSQELHFAELTLILWLWLDSHLCTCTHDRGCFRCLSYLNIVIFIFTGMKTEAASVSTSEWQCRNCSWWKWVEQLYPFANLIALTVPVYSFELAWHQEQRTALIPRIWKGDGVRSFLYLQAFTNRVVETVALVSRTRCWCYSPQSEFTIRTLWALWFCSFKSEN